MRRSPFASLAVQATSELLPLEPQVGALRGAEKGSLIALSSRARAAEGSRRKHVSGGREE